MFRYGIGLDIGITSVGWATVALNEDDNPYGILGMGTRIFDAAEQPKSGASLAAPRREARSTRRRLRRRRHRNERIRMLLINEGSWSPNPSLTSAFDYLDAKCYIERSRALLRQKCGRRPQYYSIFGRSVSYGILKNVLSLQDR